MGIGILALELLRVMDDAGLLDGQTAVAELGAQTFAPDTPHAQDAIRAMFPTLDATAIHRPRDLYRALGLTRYAAFDLDGLDGALKFDLNRSLRIEYDFTEVFDLVTNHGTTEHAFNQARCFENMHDLTRPGGIMVHVLPTQGYQNHAFFNYHPSCFLDLAGANGYDVLGLFLGIGDRLLPYTDNVLEELDIRATAFVDVVAVLRKQADKPFVTPFDGRYYVDTTDGGFQPRATTGGHRRVSENRFPLSARTPETTALCPAESRARLIRFVLPVWGKAFIESFLAFALPNQLASGALAALLDAPAEYIPAEYIIVTDAPGAALLRAAPGVESLRRRMRVRVLVADAATGEHSYGQLTRYYNLALADAVPGDAYVFLTADCFFSREVLQRCLTLLDTHRLVLAPALRVVEESFVTEVLRTGAWDIDGAALLRLAMRHEHPLTEAFTIDNPRGTHHPLPAQVLARLPQGYVGRWTVMHPLAVRIANPLHQARQTIDWNYGLLHLLGWQDVAVLDSLEHGLTVSTTPLHYDQGEAYRRGSRPRHHLSILKQWINIPWPLEFHLAQVTHPVRLLLPEPAPELAAAEAKVAGVIDRFMTYVNSRRHVARDSFHDLSTTDLLRDAIDRRQQWRRSDRLVARLKTRLRAGLKRRLGLPG
jgi:SAM-dependent methyltransferase